MDVCIGVFALFQGVRDGALGYIEVIRQQGRHQIAIGVVAYNEVSSAAAQLLADLCARVQRKLLQVGPHVKPACSKWPQLWSLQRLAS